MPDAHIIAIAYLINGCGFAVWVALTAWTYRLIRYGDLFWGLWEPIRYFWGACISLFYGFAVLVVCGALHIHFVSLAY